MLAAQQQAQPEGAPQTRLPPKGTLSLPAIAAAWALGIPLDLIGAALAQTDHMLVTETIF
jgi:hypothetical protein